MKTAALMITATLLSFPSSSKDDHGGDDRSTHSDGKCKDSSQCNDQDLSPSFDNSPVIICVQPGACEFSGE